MAMEGRLDPWGDWRKAVGSSGDTAAILLHLCPTLQPVKLSGGLGANLDTVVPDLHMMRCRLP